MVGAFAQGEILQVLLFSILFGFAIMGLGERGHVIRSFIDDAAHAVFGVISIVMKAAPIGAFGAMAFTIGKFGTGAILNLMGLIATFYLTAALFVFVVLGVIARMVGFSIFKFLAYIKDELLIVLGTSSSESALPSLMEKLERLGCSKSVVGLVVPTGYSFNLDGTNIYMTLATLFIAQALGFDLTLGQQITILLVAMLTSKGASGITGAGFITLAATLAVVDPRLVPGMAIVLGIDKFMSECRALTNLCGNGVACVVVSWWEGELDHDRLHANLNQAGRSDRHGDRGHDRLATTAAATRAGRLNLPARLNKQNGRWTLIGFRILQRTRKVDADTVAKFRELPVANISDSMSRMTAGGASLRPMHAGGVLAGPAFTVKTRPGDNLMLHKAIDIADPGDVIVVDGGGDLTNSLIGEMMSAHAEQRGIAGMVIYGSIRDYDSIHAGSFPIFAAGVTHRGPYKDGPGEINVPIAIDGMVIEPGDLIVGDGDGIVCVPFAKHRRSAEGHRQPSTRPRPSSSPRSRPARATAPGSMPA